ncbi:unnamed protein product, partial [Prorocentrum cordatum]
VLVVGLVYEIPSLGRAVLAYRFPGRWKSDWGKGGCDVPRKSRGFLPPKVSFVVSRTTQPCAPRTRAAAVQTEQPARPPPMPGALEELAARRRAAVPRARRRRGQAKVRLCTSERQVLAFEETPQHTRVTCLLGAMRRINARGRGCCMLHVSVAAARQCLDAIDLERCGGVDFGGRQCPACFALVDPGPPCDETDGGMLQDCETCGSEIYSLPPKVLSSAGSTPMASDESPAKALAPASRVSGASKFKISLDRSDGAKLGIDVDISHCSAVLVKNVLEEGLVHQWNTATKRRRSEAVIFLSKLMEFVGARMRCLQSCLRRSRWRSSS